ncbi:MAG: sigma-70 family RNA polymerase sigma factor [Candidatus Omnitrophica bacterium]|nr:sigma-70 family RNA polymerase sigma factor [Candidatus Omnitrophota bacterium]
MTEPIRSYLKDIRPISLLTAKQEIELAKRIKRGDTRAKRQMILANLRLVINIAKRYSHLGVPLLDLIEEGNLGLMRAVTKYNPQKGFRFSTYGAWWIRQYITRAIANQGKTVRIPVYMTELLSKFKRVSEQLTQKLGRKPFPQEVARKMRLPLSRVERLLEIVTASQMTSLETPVGEEGDTEMIDLLEDESAPTAEDQLTRFLQREHIDTLFKHMNERERHVLSLRYGLEDGVSRTLGETAKHFGITRERVRQIEVAAMRKLRAFAMPSASTTVQLTPPTPTIPPRTRKPVTPTSPRRAPARRSR